MTAGKWIFEGPAEANFASQWKYWSWRSAVCAAPSFIFALLGHYRTWSAIAAMVAGVATFAGGYAWISARFGPVWDRRGMGIVRRLLGMALGIRVIWSALAALGLGLNQWLGTTVLPFYLCVPDLLGGITTVGSLETGLERIGFGREVAQEWPWTYLTTLGLGGWISGTIAVLFVLCLPLEAWRRGALHGRHRVFSSQP